MTPQRFVTVKLKVAHIHEGVNFSEGSELPVSQADADWLISNGIAEAAVVLADEVKPGKNPK